MEKKQYVSPAFEIIVLDADRVITESDWNVDPQPIDPGGGLLSRSPWED